MEILILWNSFIKQGKSSHFCKIKFCHPELGARIRPLQPLKSRVRIEKMEAGGQVDQSPWEFCFPPLQEREHIQISVMLIWKERMCCVSHHYILTECIWNTCVDLGNKRNPLWPWDNSQYWEFSMPNSQYWEFFSAKQNKTLVPDNLFPRCLCLRMWGYLVSIFSKWGKKCCSVSIWNWEQAAQSTPWHSLKPI